MRLSSIFFIPSLLLFLACAATCQTQTNGKTAGQMPLIRPSQECPIVLNVERRAFGHTLLADENNAVVQSLPEIALSPPPDERRNAPVARSGVHVTLRAPAGEEAIRSADVVLRAVPRHRSATPIGAANAATIARTYHLHAAAQPQATLSGMLWMMNVAGIESVSVEAIEYASGRSWHAPQAAVCRTAPGLYLPVDK
jgi:hypothetical protein